MLALPLHPPITTSWPPRHLDLCQLSVRPDWYGARALGDDAFKLEIAGGLEHRVPRLGEMIDIFDVPRMRTLLRGNLPEPFLAFGQLLVHVARVTAEQLGDPLADVLDRLRGLDRSRMASSESARINSSRTRTSFLQVPLA